MKNRQIKYTKVLKNYKRINYKRIARKNNLINSLKKNINLIFDYFKNKAENILMNFDFSKLIDLLQNRKIQISLLIIFVLLFNFLIFAVKNKSNYSMSGKKSDSSGETYKKILSEMSPATNNEMEEVLLNIPKIILSSFTIGTV